MEDEIAADAQLGRVIFQIKPGNRYEAHVCTKDKEEIIGHGRLDQLLEYLPNSKDQVDEESHGSFKLELPNDIDKTWFTKATLTRFLHVISSPELLNKSIAISKEMSQLEETRKFHLSLYSKAEDGVMSSDNSKNELLRAMDSRLTALTEDLVSTFTEAFGPTFTHQETTNLQKFFKHFGDEGISNLMSKLAKTSQTYDEHINKTSENVQSSASSNCVKPVIYNTSPAKAAEIERQSSSESDDSSFASEDDQPSVERSRTLIRSASPRRSASPMRRVQIGRSGPRRTPAITIKSLTCFPTRDRVSFHRDTEDREEANKKIEVNVTRMSVQDAISLFESKQRDQTSDTQKKPNVLDCANANKSVLRRWSAGMGESQKLVVQNASENTLSENNSDVVDKDVLKDDDVKSNMNLTFENQEAPEIVRVDVETDTVVKNESFPSEDDLPVSQTEKFDGKTDSVEWSRQKEAELSQMLMKFAEYKNIEPDSGKMRNPRLNQRRSPVPQKDKKDEKPRVENGVKKAQSESRSKQKVLEHRKTEKSLKNVTDAGKKLGGNKSSPVKKNLPVPLTAKKEPPKPAVPKRVPSKSTPLPATRKSWPSSPSPSPSPRALGALPGKCATVTTSGTVAFSQKPRAPALGQKPLSPAPISRASPKLERPQMHQKDVKKAQVEVKKSLKRVDESKNEPVLPKSGRLVKPKPKTGGASEKDVGAPPIKGVVRKMGTKKSSVVPLEAKPSLTRKGPGTNPAKTQKMEICTQVEETSLECGDLIVSNENVDSTNPDMAHHIEVNPSSESHNGDIGEEREPEVEKPKDGSEEETFDETLTQVTPDLIISPSAWEETGQQDPPIQGGNDHDVVVVSPEPRVRHSLSQMLLEESGEPDVIEWGNAENPPTMVYQKDAPKGLKRLLKFARKNKGEANGTAWSSPYTSEGEDDGDEGKSLGKRHSDNLLRKVALNSKNYGEGFLSDSEPLSARSNASNSSARSSNKFQEGHTASKGTRFFSLSAFRSNKN